MEWIPVLVIAVLALVIIVRNIYVVQQSRAYVVERLGAFSNVWTVGIHFKVPFVERVAKKVSLKEQVLDYPPQPVITKDNVTMQIDTVVYFQITDPKLYAYGVEHPMMAMETLTATTLRNIIGDLELDQTLTSRDVINTRMRAILDEATDPWGIKGKPRRAQEHSAAAGYSELDGKADEGRARPAAGNFAGRGRKAQPDPRRRGRKGSSHFEGRRGKAGGDPQSGSREGIRNPPRRRRGAGHPRGAAGAGRFACDAE
ncbi:MAG: paraslipin [Oscillospiraceae bacterium]